ncbi:MAG: FG-GAP-like repeat-containing protein, partial [Bacteroidota bacterium]
MKRIPGIICILWMALSCQERQDTIHQTAFSKVAPDASNIHFSNDIEENDTLNYYTFPYLYMGGGVAIGDINNDGLQDVFFTGNRSANKLYLNQGDFRFRDITQDAGVSGDDRWYTGVTMADVNHDGWLDIYVCASGIHGSTTNQLYINKKDQTFSEEAKAYGLADDSPSIQSTFFDFDRDGYLDVFVANYPQLPVSQGNLFYHDRMKKNEWHESGHLYRNEGNGFFQDVTEASGVQNFGLSLGVVATDFNNDGWTDLYLSNDFNVPDYLYLNNQNGTFREVVKESTAHTSMFGMGVDAGDFNNDGWMDFAQVDMTPSDHKRSKTNMASMSPKTFYQAVDLGLHYQYMHNMVQLNNGTRQQLPLFSDVSQLLNVAKTDWSWGILFSDLNNDGLKDLFITNGILRDVNNNDANRSFEKASFFGSKSDYKKLPTTPIKNYAFQNNGNLSYTEKSREWGLEEKGFSNGVSYGDLDNDGALDLVVNNINAPASLYRNLPSSSHHFLRVNLRGPKGNPLGLGSKTEIWSNDAYQSNELTLTRGFQSSVEPIVHFGLGKSTTVDKVKVTWPDGRVSMEKNISVDQLMTISYVDSQPIEAPPIPIATPFNEMTDKLLPFRHQEDEYNDFANEPLLPHKNSTLGPASAFGDINQDSLDDVFIGNASGSVATLFTQNKLGGFERYPGPWEADSAYEDTGSVFIDIDQDGDL